MQENLSEFTPSVMVATASNIEELKFVFSQAEKRVKETADEGDRIYNKSVAIISISITLFTGLLGYIVQKFEFSPFYLASLSVAILLLSISIVLRKNIYPSIYKSIGSHPKDLLRDVFYQDLKGKTPEWHLIFSEILMYEKRLKINLEVSKKRNNRLKKAYSLLYWTPITFGGVFLLSIFFLYFQNHHLYCH